MSKLPFTCVLLLTVPPLVAPMEAEACTSVLVTRGAAADGSTMITYAADSHELYGELVVRPATRNPDGAMVDVYDWDSGKRLGRIEQAPVTYAVVGNMNEHQVAISETTFGGRSELHDPTGMVDYGSLMYFALQRARTAREAISVMTDLVARYGYASSGESFSIADAKEVWIMEMIGKGPGNKGAVWVARRLPDGTISAHANQARIRRFPLNDASNTLYAKDVISFARKAGYFSGKDEEFSFADAYVPADYGALRFCEARVWNVFRRAAASLPLAIDYVMGVEGAEPLPLWIRPDRKLSVQDVMAFMRDHFEGTELDLSAGVGAGPYHLPYRWRPLTWKSGGKEYLNERAISTQQTGFSLVAQARDWLPDPVGGVLWFGVDDTYSTVYVPMYCGMRAAPESYAPGVATLHRFSWDSAFWVFNWVANLAYSRYDAMIGDIQVVQRELEGDLVARLPEVDRAALKLFAESPELARDYLTRYSVEQAQRVVARWRKLGEDLLVKYLDGNVKDEHGHVTHPGYPEDWYARIAADSGDKLAMRKMPGEPGGAAAIPNTGFFHSREELGGLAEAVPEEFPFSSEKLVLLLGNDRCSRPPRCCLTPQADPATDRLVVEVPEAGEDACGVPSWLIRVLREERRPVVQGREGH